MKFIHGYGSLFSLNLRLLPTKEVIIGRRCVVPLRRRDTSRNS